MFKQGSKYKEIEYGARVCKLLKKYYFESTPWGDCHKQIGAMFTTTKLLAKNMYKELNKTEIIDLLAKYDKQDFEDLLNAKTNGLEPNRDSADVAKHGG